MTPSNLRSISRQLYSPVTTFADARPVVAPSDYVASYETITVKSKFALKMQRRRERRKASGYVKTKNFCVMQLPQAPLYS